MKEEFHKHLYWGLTALAVVAASIAFGFCILRFDAVSAAVRTLLGILMPIIYGGVLAYLMLPVYNYIRQGMERRLAPLNRSQVSRTHLAKTTATLGCLLLLVVIVTGLFWLLIPQVYESLLGLQGSMESNLNHFYHWINRLLRENPELERTVTPYVERNLDQFQSWLTLDFLPNISLWVARFSLGIWNVVTVVKNLLIGVIVMVYFLNIKDTLCAQSKKIIYSLFEIRQANRIVHEFRFVHRVFGGFITGKLLDSLIIGILCFLGVRLLGMPYMLLISVIVGVTNIIPFFGPFIGAIPSAFLILLVDPMKCLYFLIFILLLQQFDGNILGPKILGDSTGLPSFWVLFSILLFGGLFGFVGMIIAVPFFAVLYRFVSLYVAHALRRKRLSEDTRDYGSLDYIDQDGQYVEREQER